jgi:hypothetical protein
VRPPAVVPRCMRAAPAAQPLETQHANAYTHNDAQEVTGTVFAYDASTQSLVLQQNGSHGGVHNLRLYAKPAIKVCAQHSVRRSRPRGLCGANVMQPRADAGQMGGSDRLRGGEARLQVGGQAIRSRLQHDQAVQLVLSHPRQQSVPFSAHAHDLL